MNISPEEMKIVLKYTIKQSIYNTVDQIKIVVNETLKVTANGYGEASKMYKNKGFQEKAFVLETCKDLLNKQTEVLNDFFENIKIESEKQ